MRQKPQELAVHWSATPLVHILGPMQDFIQRSQSSGIILLVMTVIAVVIANSPSHAETIPFQGQNQTMAVALKIGLQFSRKGCFLSK